MPRTEYTFRLQMSVPLLTEDEWQEVRDLLKDRVLGMKEHLRANQCSLSEAAQNELIGQRALARYEELTGYKLNHPDQLWAVRMSLYGELCPNCGKPFRTPSARMCAECGYALPNGMVAGPLTEAGS